MDNHSAAKRIDDFLASQRGGCMCTLRENCERCSSFGPAAKMEAMLRSLARELRGEPEPPVPTLKDYGTVFVAHEFYTPHRFITPLRFDYDVTR